MKTTVEIKKMGINGEGIGYINRKIVFIKGALLNEEVEIDAKQYNNKNYYFGDLIRVIKPSPMRVKNPCRANKECMGCNLLHYAYPAQLKHKKDLIKESLKSVSINIFDNIARICRCSFPPVLGTAIIKKSFAG